MGTRAAALILALVLVGPAAAQPKQPPKSSLPQPGAGPATNKVNGLELVLENETGYESVASVDMDVNKRFVSVRAQPAKLVLADKDKKSAEYDPQLVWAEWVVLTVGKTPAVTKDELTPQNDIALVGLPAAGESLFIQVNALLKYGDEKAASYFMTKHCLLVVRATGSDAGPQPLSGVDPRQVPDRPAAVPPNVKNLSVLLFVDDKAAAAKEVADVGGSAAVRAGLAASGSSFFYEDMNGPLARRPDIARKIMAARRPCLLVLAPNGQVVGGQPIPLPYVGYTDQNQAEARRQNEVILLDVVGKAAGGR